MKLFVRLAGESFAFAWNSLVVNRLRTVLSLLGVTIGIFSIIFVLSVVDSMEADIKESLSVIGPDLLFVQKWPMGPEKGAKEYEWWKYMKRRQPSTSDMDKLKSRLEGSEAMAFTSGINKSVQYGNSFVNDANVQAVSYSYNDVMPVKLTSGRYFTEHECDAGVNYGIIGWGIAENIFGGTEPIGKEIRVGGLSVIVIGVMKKEGASLFGNGTDMAIILPIRYGLRLLDADERDSNIIVKAKEGVSPQELSNEVTSVFREVRGVKPGADNDFSIIEASMISSAVDQIVGVFNTAGIVIGLIAILVGAFSIANIMFVSVSERTNIIGIQKALGARNSFVLTEFLFESVALCIFGGTIGILLVWAINLVLTRVFEFHFILLWVRVALGIGISISVGLVAGIFPAWKAARLNPVDSMRSK
jgi:putative ABC transport system permease protein